MCFFAAALRRVCLGNSPVSAFGAVHGDDKEELTFFAYSEEYFINLLMPFSLFREKRRTAGRTQAELGQQAGLSVPSIRMLEPGERSIARAQSAMAALGLTWAWPQPITEDPRDALARLRREVGLLQRAMARAIGTTQPTIIALEKRFIGTLPRLLAFLKRVGHPDRAAHPGALQRRLVPKSNAPEQDVVLTPELLVARIAGVVADRMKGDVLDPCRGDGAFFNAFPTHVTSHWCEIGEGRDFFGWSRKVDWLVTNPPYSKLHSFLIHAMVLASALWRKAWRWWSAIWQLVGGKGNFWRH